MAPRLVATDLDGTLVRSDGSVSELTQRVLAELDERDVPVVLVTAAPALDGRPVADGRRHGFAIVATARSGTTSRRPGARPARHRGGGRAALVAAIERAVPDAGFAVETLSGIAMDRRYVDHHGSPRAVRSAARRRLDRAAVKCWCSTRSIRRSSGAGHGRGRRRRTPTWSGDRLMEISARASPRRRRWPGCRELGVSAAEVLAFGDMPNDIAMLEWAGTAYAVANADPTVIEVADPRVRFEPRRRGGARADGPVRSGRLTLGRLDRLAGSWSDLF